MNKVIHLKLLKILHRTIGNTNISEKYFLL